MTTLRDQLKAGLAGATPEPGAETLGVSELAEHIKALKAAHTIEATPERVGKRRSSAEEPVTARIRRRTEAIAGSEPAMESDADESPTGTSLAPEATGLAIPGHSTPSG